MVTTHPSAFFSDGCDNQKNCNNQNPHIYLTSILATFKVLRKAKCGYYHPNLTLQNHP